MDMVNTSWKGEVTRDTGDSYELKVRFLQNNVAGFNVHQRDGNWSGWVDAWEWHQTANVVVFGSEKAQVTYRCNVLGYRMEGTGTNLGKKFSIWLELSL